MVAGEEGVEGGVLRPAFLAFVILPCYRKMIILLIDFLVILYGECLKFCSI